MAKITDLPVASTIDATADVLAIVTNSINTTQQISRNTLLNLSSDPVGKTDTQTLTNKTLTAPAISSPVLSGTVTGTYTLGGTPTFPATVVTTTGVQTITNKTLTSPTINSPTLTNATISADSITGYTTSTTGTIYGISVTSSTIGSSALAANSVTSSKLAYGLIYQRQGGSATSWYTSGTTNYSSPNTGNTNIQVGTIAVSTATDQTVTFPTAFTNAPIVTAAVSSAVSNNAWCAINTVTTTGFKIRTFNTAGTQIYTETACWIAVGI